MLKKVLLGFLGVLVLLLALGGVTMVLSSRPLTKEEGYERFVAYFDKASKPSKAFSGVQARVFSEKQGVDWVYAKGSSLRAGELTADQPFHVASVGKLFTATVIYQLAEEGKIQLDEPILESISPDRLSHLFVYEGVDHKGEVTFAHLLSHTSGIADYFDGPVTSGEKVTTLMRLEPDYVWTPEAMLDVSRDRQVAVSAPGEGYYYSDSGYVLLGLLIEAIEGEAFERVLEKRIFGPLAMHDSALAPSAQAKGVPIADLWLDGVEYGDKPVLSVDWAGGGVVSTLEDLLKFSVALHGGELIGEASLEAMFDDVNAFEKGIYTGAGGMSIRFKAFFPLLNLPKVRGHIGILSTHLFYDPETETHIVMNFGSDEQMVKSFKALIEILLLGGRFL